MKDTIFCNSGDDTRLTTWDDYSHVMVGIIGDDCNGGEDTIHGQFTPEDAHAFGLHLIASAEKVWRQGRAAGQMPPFPKMQAVKNDVTT